MSKDIDNLNDSETMQEKSAIYKFFQPFIYIWKNFKSVIITFFVVLFIFNFIILNGNVPSSSMENTIMTKDHIIAFRLAYWFDNPQHGDIIIFNSEQSNHKEYIKRVIGTPGDTIKISDGHVFRNGELLQEDYTQGITDIGDNMLSEFTVPDDCVFVLGDNRENSRDSRYMSNPYIKYSDITGKLILRYSIFSNGFFFKPM